MTTKRRGPHRCGPLPGMSRPGSVPVAQTPFMSATSYPPTGFPRSTFGDGGLNCRVRNGIG